MGTSGIENGRSGLQLPSRLGLFGKADPLNRSAQTRQNTCQTEGVDGGAREPRGANQRGLCGLDFCQKKRSDFSAGNSVNSGAVRKAAANAGRVDEKRKDFAAILQEGAPGLLFIPPGDAPGTLRPLFFHD